MAGVGDVGAGRSRGEGGVAMAKLGKNQTALLLIIEQVPKLNGEDIGRMFVWEESIQYRGADGELTSFYMMPRDLKSLAALCDRGLIRKRRTGYSDIFTVTEAGRIEVERLREQHDPSYRPPSTGGWGR